MAGVENNLIKTNQILVSDYARPMSCKHNNQDEQMFNYQNNKPECSFGCNQESQEDKKLQILEKIVDYLTGDKNKCQHKHPGDKNDNIYENNQDIGNNDYDREPEYGKNKNNPNIDQKILVILLKMAEILNKMKKPEQDERNERKDPYNIFQQQPIVA